MAIGRPGCCAQIADHRQLPQKVACPVFLQHVVGLVARTVENIYTKELIWLSSKREGVRVVAEQVGIK